MTIDEAIKHCLEVAEHNETLIKRGYAGGCNSHDCSERAENHRQLAEWLTELKARRLLMDKVCTELAELYGSPCQKPKAENFMRENGFCEDCKIIISDKECWFRYFHRKFNDVRMDGDING